MIFCRHVPSEPLVRFIDWFWFFEDFDRPHRCEHVLPEGTLELVIDLRDEPRRLFHRDDTSRHTTFRRGWLSGTHSQYIVIDALPGASMIGVHFKAGGATPFLGLPAEELRDQVVELDSIWGSSAWEMRDRLLAARGPRAKFCLLEELLLALLSRDKADATRRRRISWALGQFLQSSDGLSIRAVVDKLGMSHKHFIDQFQQQVGLTPKLFCRVRRFQEVLSRVKSRQKIQWSEIACSCGYFDQSHFVRDFHNFSGLSPAAYLTHDWEDPNFVPVEARR